jgi:hypothetical protein
MSHLCLTEHRYEPVDQDSDQKNQVKAERQEGNFHHWRHLDLRVGVLPIDGLYRSQRVLEEF